MSDVENVNIIQGIYSRNEDRNNQSEDEFNIWTQCQADLNRVLI